MHCDGDRLGNAYTNSLAGSLEGDASFWQRSGWQAAGRQIAPLLAHLWLEEDMHQAEPPGKAGRKERGDGCACTHLVSSTPGWCQSKWLLCGSELGPKMPPSPHRQQRISCHYGSNQTERESVLPFAKDSPGEFFLETALEVRVGRGENELRNAVKLSALAANSTGPGT